VPSPKLHAEQLDFIMAAKKCELNNSEIARRLGVTEGAVRYRLKRKELELTDGRKDKISRLDAYQGLIEAWLDHYLVEGRRPPLKKLYWGLRLEHGLSASYDALRRFVRRRFPEISRKGHRIRLETPPGQLMQLDWKENIMVQMGSPGNWVRVNAMLFLLAHSRKSVVIFSVRRDLDAFLHGHVEAFRRLGGLPAMLRPDCLKTAIRRWRGLRSDLNTTYRRFLEGLDIVVFPSRPATPTDKGKVEKRIRDLFGRLDLEHRVFAHMADLQAYTDRMLELAEQEWRCGATGLSVARSFENERRHLRPLPADFPAWPLLERRAVVRRDGTVWFDGNYYQVPRACIGKEVLCQHSGTMIAIWSDGQELGRFEHLPGARGMVRLAEAAIADRSIYLSDTVRFWGLEVARRQVDIYHDITRRSL
jgi:transposase